MAVEISTRKTQRPPQIESAARNRGEIRTWRKYKTKGTNVADSGNASIPGK